jgi:transposase
VPSSGDGFSRRYSVVAETRWRWSEDENQAIVGEVLQPGVNVSAVARRHGIKPSLLFRGPERSEAIARAGVPCTLPAVRQPINSAGQRGKR